MQTNFTMMFYAYSLFDYFSVCKHKKMVEVFFGNIRLSILKLCLAMWQKPNTDKIGAFLSLYSDATILLDFSLKFSLLRIIGSAEDFVQ